MYARTTTVHGNPAAIDSGAAFLRNKVMPAVEGLPGYVGLSMLADRDTGRCIATTSWVDEAAMTTTGNQLRGLRARYAEILGGAPVLQSWQIAVLHRAHEAPAGASTRVTWLRGAPDALEGAIDAFRMSLLPRLDDLPGFCSVSLLTSAAAGTAVSAVTYDSQEYLHGTRMQARTLRGEFAPATGLAVTDIGEFELVLAHLRVPETV